MCLVLFIGRFWIAQSTGKKAVGKVHLLSRLPCRKSYYEHNSFISTVLFSTVRSCAWGSLEVKRIEVPTARWLWRDTSAIRSYLIPCPQEIHREGNRNQTVLWCWKISRLRDIASKRWVQSRRRAASIAPNCFFDALCAVFNVTHGITMQDSSQKFASESR